MAAPQDNWQQRDRIFALLHLRSAPRQCHVVSYGYDKVTPSGKRDMRATTMLCVLLFITAVVVNGFVSPLQLVSVRTEICETQEKKLADNLETMRNVTSHAEALEAASDRVHLANDAFMLANATYNALGTEYIWPAPFELSEEERQELETQAAEGGDDCEQVCIPGIRGFVLGFLGEKCHDVPCPDVKSTELLMQYDASQQALDLSGDPITIDTSLYEDELDTLLTGATDAISVLVKRINIASSCYVLYLAFLILFPAPFIVYRADWKQICYSIAANVNKPVWVAIVIVVWYAYGAFKSILQSSMYRLLWANFVKEPCWGDASFLASTASTISQVCVNVSSAHNLFSQANNNYRYYEAVENTWEVASPEGGPFYDEPDDVLAQDFPGNCSSAALLLSIQPSDGNVDWSRLLWNSRAAAALFLQFVLANWLISFFTLLLRPLTICRGQVMLPNRRIQENHNEGGRGGHNDDAARDTENGNVPNDGNEPNVPNDVKGFIRMRAVMPLFIHSVLLAVILGNLLSVKSEQDFYRAVNISLAVFSGFILITVPCIFRCSE